MLNLNSFQAVELDNGKLFVRMPYQNSESWVEVNGEKCKLSECVINKDDVVKRISLIRKGIEKVTLNGNPCMDLYLASREFINDVEDISDLSAGLLEKYIECKKTVENCVINYFEPERKEEDVVFDIVGYLIDTKSKYIECAASFGKLSPNGFFKVDVKKFCIDVVHELSIRYGVTLENIRDGVRFAKHGNDYLFKGNVADDFEKFFYAQSLEKANEILQSFRQKNEDAFFVKFSNKKLNEVSLKDAIEQVESCLYTLSKMECNKKSQSDKFALLKKLKDFKQQLIDACKGA